MRITTFAMAVGSGGSKAGFNRNGKDNWASHPLSQHAIQRKSLDISREDSKIFVLYGGMAWGDFQVSK